MGTQPVRAWGTGNKSRVMAAPIGKTYPGASLATKNAALWTSKSCSPDSHATTVSEMWASSIVWAAENLATLFSTTVNNVKRSR